MAVLTQTVTTETAINWEELAQKIKDNTSGLKVGDIITEKTLDGEEMDLVVVDMGPGWARFESKDCLPVEVAYNQNNRNAGGFADSDVKRYLNEEVFNSLPEELRNVIAEVERKQENGESSLCRLFLPTESELFGDCCYSENDSPFYGGVYLYTRLKIKQPILSKEIIYPVIFFNHRYYASNTDTVAGFIRYRSIIYKYRFNSISISDVNT